MYNMYLKNPVILAIFGSLLYYLIERFDCYINARKTSSLNRRTVIVFLILVSSLYFIIMDNNTQHGGEMFTDIAPF
jgi:hypothetical protein